MAVSNTAIQPEYIPDAGVTLLAKRPVRPLFVVTNTRFIDGFIGLAPVRPGIINGISLAVHPNDAIACCRFAAPRYLGVSTE